VADNGNCRIVVYSILGGKLATFGDSFDSVTLGPLLKDAQGCQIMGDNCSCATLGTTASAYLTRKRAGICEVLVPVLARVLGG
jgi:hypothetical protein